MTSEQRQPSPIRPATSSPADSLVALITLVVAGGMLAGCAPADSGQMTPQQEAALEDTLLSLTEEVDAAFRALDPEPYLDLYSDDVHFYYRGSHLPREKFEKVVRQEMAVFDRFSTEMINPQVEVLGPDAGVVSFRYRGEVVDTAGATQDISAAVTVVFERRGGEWTAVQAHESFPPPEE